MIQQKTDEYIRVCVTTWLHCEANAQTELASEIPREKLIQECRACAMACVAVMVRLMSHADNMGELVINCLIHCRQCCRECEKYRQEWDIRYCGMVSRHCADTLRDLVDFPLN